MCTPNKILGYHYWVGSTWSMHLDALHLLHIWILRGALAGVPPPWWHHPAPPLANKNGYICCEVYHVYVELSLKGSAWFSTTLWQFSNFSYTPSFQPPLTLIWRPWGHQTLTGSVFWSRSPFQNFHISLEIYFGDLFIWVDYTYIWDDLVLQNYLQIHCTNFDLFPFLCVWNLLLEAFIWHLRLLLVLLPPIDINGNIFPR